MYVMHILGNQISATAMVVKDELHVTYLEQVAYDRKNDHSPHETVERLAIDLITLLFGHFLTERIMILINEEMRRCNGKVHSLYAFNDPV